MIELLQKNYILVILAVIVAIIIQYIENLISFQKNEKQGYIKTAIAVAIVTTAVVYIHTLYPKMEEILITPPPF